MKQEKKRIALIGFALAIIAIFGLLGADYYLAPDVDVPIGREQLVDDFGLTVIGAHRQGREIVLNITFTNHSKRVQFSFDSSKVKVFGVDGEELPLITGFETSIPAGESITKEFHYDETGSTGPYKVRFENSADILAQTLTTLAHEQQHSIISP